MAQQTPKDAIREQIALYHTMQPESLVFVRALRRHGREIHAVRFEETNGARWRFYYTVEQGADGTWQTQGGGGGGEADPQRAYPWVNLAGTYAPNGLALGGSVADYGRGVATVRLLDGATVLGEDAVQEGTVLFLTERGVADPETLVAELYDAQGALVSRHNALRARQQV